MLTSKFPRTIEWVGNLDGHIQLIDQTLLPQRLELLKISDADSLFQAIRSLQVRGAPAIGIAAAMGLVLAVRDAHTADRDEFLQLLDGKAQYLSSSRPTAVNLTWALGRLRQLARHHKDASVAQLKLLLLSEAKAIRDEDAATCRAIARNKRRVFVPAVGALFALLPWLIPDGIGRWLAKVFGALDLMKRVDEEGRDGYRQRVLPPAGAVEDGGESSD